MNWKDMCTFIMFFASQNYVHRYQICIASDTACIASITMVLQDQMNRRTHRYLLAKLTSCFTNLFSELSSWYGAFKQLDNSEWHATSVNPVLTWTFIIYVFWDVMPFQLVNNGLFKDFSAFIFKANKPHPEYNPLKRW
jgi:hypothetical protein